MSAVAAALQEVDRLAGPCADDPLRGLVHLPKVAICGSARYLALAAEPVVYTWDGVAMQGITVGLTGAPGEGKTTLMFLIAVARAVTDGTITPVLGLDVTPAPEGNWIVIVEAEHGEQSTSRKLVKSAGLLGLDPSCLDRVITIARKSVLLDSPEWADVEKMIAAGIVADVFVDSISRFAPGDANDEKEQAAIFGKIAAAIEKSKGTQPTFWIVMHSRKGMSTGNTEDISGSTQRGGQLDSAIRCTAVRDDQLRITHVEVTFPKLREDPDEHPGKRAFAVERTGSAWRYRDVDVEEIAAVKRTEKQAAKQAAEQSKRAAHLSTLRNVLREHPGASRNHLRTLMRAAIGKIGNESVDTLIEVAAAEGWLRHPLIKACIVHALPRHGITGLRRAA